MDIKQVNNEINELKEKINNLTNLLSYLDFYKVIKSVSITSENSIDNIEKLETAFLGLPVNSAFSVDVNIDGDNSFKWREHELHTGSVVLKFFGNKEEVISPPESGVWSPAVINDSLIKWSYSSSSTEAPESVEISLASAQFKEESINPGEGTITAPTPNVHFFDKDGEEVFFSPSISIEDNMYKFGGIPSYVSYCKYVAENQG